MMNKTNCTVKNPFSLKALFSEKTWSTNFTQNEKPLKLGKMINHFYSSITFSSKL